MFGFRSLFLRAGSACIVLAASAPLSANPSSADPADQSSAVKLYPAAGWNIDYGEKHCRLARIFGEEGDHHLVYLEQIAPSASFTIAFAGSKLDRWQSRRDFDFSALQEKPSDTVESHDFGELGQFGPMISFKTSLDGIPAPDSPVTTVGIDPDLAKRVNRLLLSKGEEVLSFETGEMEQAFAALNACTMDMLASWGLDPEKHQNYTRVSQEDVSRTFQRALDSIPNRVGSGLHRWVMIIDEDGHPTNCMPVYETMSPRDQKTTCKGLMRLEFIPAIDGEGKPMQSFTTIEIKAAG